MPNQKIEAFDTQLELNVNMEKGRSVVTLAARTGESFCVLAQ
jgi:hypothetical protein